MIVVKEIGLYDASFAVIGPKLWNVLPEDINVFEKEVTFKIELTKFIYKLRDQPPVQGYLRNHGNSLVEEAGLHMAWSDCGAANYF